VSKDTEFNVDLKIKTSLSKKCTGNIINKKDA
jgi:hypothetical protein